MSSFMQLVINLCLNKFLVADGIITYTTLNLLYAEYGMGNEVSPSGDDYSYGILLLEMFTGKRPTDSMFSENLTLRNFSMLEQVASFVDPTIVQIDQNHSSSSTHKIQECLVSVLKIGIACSHDLPTDRMGIKDVVPQLHGIRNTFT